MTLTPSEQEKIYNYFLAMKESAPADLIIGTSSIVSDWEYRRNTEPRNYRDDGGENMTTLEDINSAERRRQFSHAEAMIELSRWVSNQRIFVNNPYSSAEMESFFLHEMAEEAEHESHIQQIRAERERTNIENRGENMTNQPSPFGYIAPSWKSRADHEYRNGLNHEMKNTAKLNHKAINDNKGKHWQEKFEPESSEYYNRLCDGNYRRIGNSKELPEQIQGAVIVEMGQRIVSLEKALDDIINKRNDPYETNTYEIQKSVARLIDRSTKRANAEAINYKESYYREQDRKNKLIEENRALKAENERLKKTGLFPVEKKGFETLSDREKRFTSIDV